jgi:Redoxin
VLLALQAKGVDTIACLAVNDAFVLDAWGKTVGADGKVLLLADGSGLFTKVQSQVLAELLLLDLFLFNVQPLTLTRAVIPSPCG